MSHTSKEQYLESCRQRYPCRNRAGKSAMIDEVSDTLGWAGAAKRLKERDNHIGWDSVTCGDPVEIPRALNTQKKRLPSSTATAATAC